MRNFRGTCSSVETLKGYMVRKRLGAFDLGPWFLIWGTERFVRAASMAAT